MTIIATGQCKFQLAWNGNRFFFFGLYAAYTIRHNLEIDVGHWEGESQLLNYCKNALFYFVPKATCAFLTLILKFLRI